MALDYGRRRIGVAVTDPTRTIATPRGVIERPRPGAPASTLPQPLITLVEELEPAAILVGIPFSMDGTAGAMAEEARAFAGTLREVTGIAIIEWDERLSTARAEREILAMQLPKGKRRRKGRTDEVAASLMLSAYLRGVATVAADAETEAGGP